MSTRSKNPFSTVTSSGMLLPLDLLVRIADGAAGFESTMAVLNWMKIRSRYVWIRRLKTQVRCIAEFRTPLQPIFPVKLLASGVLVFQMRFVSGWPPFDSAEKRQELQEKLEHLNGWNIRGGMTGLPQIDLKQLKTDEERAKLLKVLDWMIDELTRESPSSGTASAD